MNRDEILARLDDPLFKMPVVTVEQVTRFRDAARARIIELQVRSTCLARPATRIKPCAWEAQTA